MPNRILLWISIPSFSFLFKYQIKAGSPWHPACFLLMTYFLSASFPLLHYWLLCIPSSIPSIHSCYLDHRSAIFYLELIMPFFFRWFGEEFQVIKHIKWFFSENFLLLFFKFICYGKLPHHYSLDSLGKIKITLIVSMLQTIKQTYFTFIVQQYHGYFHGSHIGYCNRLSPSPIT